MDTCSNFLSQGTKFGAKKEENVFKLHFSVKFVSFTKIRLVKQKMV